MDMPNVVKARWWNARGNLATAEAVSESLAIMKPYHDRRVQQAVWYAKLYGSQAQVGPFGISFSQASVAAPGRSSPSQLRYNAIGTCVDTIQSRVAARVKPRSWWLPSGSNDYKIQRKAQQLNTFSDGIMLEQQLQKLGRLIMRDATIWGTGVGHNFMSNGRLRVERVLESELWTDEQESLFGNPRQMHLTRALDRGTVAETWAKEDGAKRGFILREGAVSAGNLPVQQQSAAELIEVRESWRLADGPDKPGRHVITLADCVLFDEPWPFDWFPFAFLRFSEPQIGFWGHGLCEALEPLQMQLNYVLAQIQNAQRVAGTFKLLYEINSAVSPDSFDGTLGPTIPYHGTPPAWLVPPAVPAELYAERDRLLALIHQEAGVSQLSSVGQSELGPGASGSAIRTVLEVQQDRFATLSEGYSQMFLDANKQGILLVKNAVDSGQLDTYEVKVVGNVSRSVVDWKTLDFDADTFHLQAWPVSSLPLEPEGRLAALNERVQNGWMSMDVAKQVQDLPDIEALSQSENADRLWIEACINRIVDDGIPMRPAAEDNLALWVKLLGVEIQLAKRGQLEDERIDLLRDALEEAVRLQNAVAPVLPPVQTSTSGAPLATPAPAPVSNSLPFPTAVAPQ